MLCPLPFGNDEAKLLVEDPLLASLAPYRQLASFEPEAGGILMGYRRGAHIHITEATFPSKDDVRNRFRFFRHANHHQSIALQRWEDTDRTLDYVGEWHTHPEDAPVPSHIDLKHWREIAVGRRCPMVFVIVGRRSNWIGVGHFDQIHQVSPLQK